MHKFYSIAALCGDGLQPELRELFERLAIDPHSGLHIRHDGMVQAGPDPARRPLKLNTEIQELATCRRKVKTRRS
jgi:hypothetical protein